MTSQTAYKPIPFSSQNKLENTPVFHSSFTGKEKDTETGYYYFGARYYNSDFSIWLSVDPMADKYPGLSPYNYCAWNPMRLVDPDGDSIVLKGDAELIQCTISDMQRRTENLNFNVDKNGVVSCTGNPVSDDDEYMLAIINDKQISVNVHLQRNSKISDNIEMFEGACDAFGGSEFFKKGEKKYASTKQYVNVTAMMRLDPLKNGDLIWHAISEAFEGGKMAIDMDTSVKFQDNNYKYVYQVSHNNANYRFCGNINGFGFDREHIMYYIDRF